MITVHSTFRILLFRFAEAKEKHDTALAHRATLEKVIPFIKEFESKILAKRQEVYEAEKVCLQLFFLFFSLAI